MPTLQPGDIFLLNSGGWLNRAINFFQSFYSRDHKSDYIHAGIILDVDGQTFETTKWRTGNRNLFADYPGSNLLIARWEGMTSGRFATGYVAVGDQMNKIYPYHRLALFALRLSGWVHWKGMVCSELVSKFLNCAGFARPWWGVNVDDLHDEIVNSLEWSRWSRLRGTPWTIVFEGNMHLWEGE